MRGNNGANIDGLGADWGFDRTMHAKDGNDIDPGGLHYSSGKDGNDVDPGALRFSSYVGGGGVLARLAHRLIRVPTRFN